MLRRGEASDRLENSRCLADDEILHVRSEWRVTGNTLSYTDSIDIRYAIYLDMVLNRMFYDAIFDGSPYDPRILAVTVGWLLSSSVSFSEGQRKYQ